MSHRLSSIQTRIKTLPLLPLGEGGKTLIDYLPFKQGLRLETKTACIVVAVVAHRLSSIQTRIKTHYELLDFSIEK